MQATEDVVGSTNGTGVLAAVPQEADQALNGDAHGLTELLHALQAMRVGDFSVRMAGDRVGLMGKTADTYNEFVSPTQRMPKELERVGRVVARAGRPRQRVRLGLS